MKITGHNYENDVFHSLLNAAQKKALKKTAQKKQQPVVDINFTQTTQSNFDNVVTAEMEFMASELLYAAKNSGVELTGEDLRAFASESMEQKLRGKNLERAARKYCNKISKNSFRPVGTTKISSVDELINQANNSTIMPASYPTDSMNMTKPCGYMGMSKNPNTIWDSEALTNLAKKTSDRTKMYGDEQIKISQQEREEFAENQKRQMWEEKQNELSDSQLEQMRNKIASQNVSTTEQSSFNPNLSSNSMSIFSQDRDFNNIPVKTEGEMIKQHAQDRSEKSVTAKNEWNQVKPAMKADNSGNFLFKQEPAQEISKSQRAATDRLFDGLLSYIKNNSSD